MLDSGRWFRRAARSALTPRTSPLLAIYSAGCVGTLWGYRSSPESPMPCPTRSIALALLALGCSDAPGPGTAEETGPVALDSIEVDWQPCSLIDGADDGLAECATVTMPMFWLDDDGRSFETAAKRLVNPSRTPSGQLWLLHGGPGASGTIGLASWMAAIQADRPDLDLYTLDPRGTGYSGYLECPDQQAASSDQGAWVTLGELDDCVAYVEEHYGDHLEVYGATSAAWDLAALMEATEREGVRQLIWGGSGGTFWAQRYLQFFPDQAEGVVIEGIVPPGESLVFQDEYDDLIGHRVLELCGEDPFCSSKLPDPEGTLTRLLVDLDAGHCSALNIDADGLRAFIRTMDYYQLTMAMVPALLYRLERCDPEDMNAIVNFYYALWGGEADPHESSTLLFFNEGWSELWEHERFPTNADLLAYLDEVHANSNLTMGLGYDRNEYYLTWPRYADPYDDTWADSDVPMLMLQGELDPSTPLEFAQAVGEHFDGDHQNWLTFAYSPHNVISGSPLSTAYPPEHCGERLFYAFLDDPQGELDEGCVDEVVPPDFEGLVYAPYVFGTEDYWENTGKGVAGPPSVGMEAEIAQARRRLREASVRAPEPSPTP